MGGGGVPRVPTQLCRGRICVGFDLILTVKASIALALARVTATTYTFCSLVYMNEHMPRLTTGLPPRSLPLMISVLNALAMLRLGKGGGREEEGARVSVVFPEVIGGKIRGRACGSVWYGWGDSLDVVAVLPLQDHVAAEVEEVQRAQRHGRVTRHARPLRKALILHDSRPAYVLPLPLGVWCPSSRDPPGLAETDRSLATTPCEVCGTLSNPRWGYAGR